MAYSSASRRCVLETIATTVCTSFIASPKVDREENPYRIGDIVLMIDPQAPRNIWRKAVIEKVFAGKDGQVRVVELRTATGTFTRGVRYLIKLCDCEVQNA